MFIHSSKRPVQVAPQHAPLKASEALAPAPAPAPASAAVPNSDTVTLSEREQYQQTVSRTADDWGVTGQKLGALSLVAAGAAIIPFQTLMRFPNMPLPAALALSIGTLAGLSIEERKIGIGKSLGKVVGQALGGAVGHTKAMAGWHSLNSKEPVQLKREEPSQVKHDSSQNPARI